MKGTKILAAALLSASAGTAAYALDFDGMDGISDPDMVKEMNKADESNLDNAMSQGRDPEALDKEYLRLWLGEQGYKGEGPPPEIPDSVRCEAARRYIEAFEQVTGRAFEPNTEEPVARIRRNLGLP